MIKRWSNPIELPWVFDVGLPIVEVLGSVAMSAIFLWFPTEDKKINEVLRAIFFVVAGFVIVLSIVKTLIEKWGTPAKPFVECLLRELSREIWKVDPEKLQGPQERHRITLFRVAPRAAPYRLLRAVWRWVPNRFRLPEPMRESLHTQYSHKLIPCMRIPLSAKQPERVFYVHEQFHDHCEGIAGVIYSFGRAASEVLPDIHVPNVSDDLINTYAKLTNDSPGKVRHNLYYSRRIAGVTIYVDGLRWGLLVLDSSDPAAVDEAHLDSGAMKRTLGILTAILEEGLA